LSYRIQAYGRSHVGQVRRRNEDTMAVEPSKGIVVVADGMGGAPAGDIASALAVQEVIRGLRARKPMAEAITRANRKLLDMVAKQSGLAGMGTTVTALLVAPETGHFAIGHVGDSRAYRLSKGIFSQITEDHTLVRELVRSGKIAWSQVREHPLGHVLSRALGVEDGLEVEEVEGVVEDGDRFLLCSDGLLKVMEDPELEDRVRRADPGSLKDAVDAMVEEGNLRGAPDNITVAILAADASPFSRRAIPES
jgi:serine/threonine protein phosphatase PrpC